MRVFIANFGRENYEWPACLARSTVATMNEVDVQPFWVAGDREEYVRRRMLGRTVAGLPPTRPVASRWYNLMTTVSETAGDLWIHRERDELWWTVSLDAPPTFEDKDEPIERGARVTVCHKPCEPWSDRDRTGGRLSWDGLHPKAREFLFTEGTLQKLRPDNAAYALALVGGGDLSAWHARPDWKAKTVNRLGKGGPVTHYDGLRKAVFRMAYQAFRTAAQSNGQEVTRTLKDKRVLFGSPTEMEAYLTDLHRLQEGLCALTGLRMELDGDGTDPEMLCSLDRIDSDGHYERGNLQVVCRFANRWKGAGTDAAFRRLIEAVRASGD